MDMRLAVLWNNTSGLENCPICRHDFDAEVGYQVFGFRRRTPAIEARIVCSACTCKQEPALLELIELHRCYAKYTAEMETLDRAGDLGRNK